MPKPIYDKPYVHFFFASLGILILVLAVSHPFAAKTTSDSGNTFSIMSLRIPYLPPHEHTISNTVVDSIGAPGHGVALAPVLYTFSEDTWVTRIELVVDNAPSSIVHHIFLENIDIPNLLCSKNRNEEMVTMGSDTPSVMRFPAPYGMFFKKGTRLWLRGMLHNPLPPSGEGGRYKDVSVGFKLTATNDGTRYKPLSFYRLFLDETPHCSGPSTQDGDLFSVPANTDFKKSSDTEAGQNPTAYTFPQSGVIVSMGAHLHPWEGGKKVDVFLNGKPIRSFAPVNVPPHPWTWETPGNVELLSVVAGDRISFATTYTNQNTLPLTDAMGMLGFFFSPDTAAPTQNTMTLLTTPLPVLAPHEHTISNTVVDSITAPGHEIEVNSDIFTIPEDMWVTDTRLVVKNAPRFILHHLVLFKVMNGNTTPPSYCTENNGEILIAMGSDTPQITHLEKPYGYFLKKGTKLMVNGMLHNPLPPLGEGGTYNDVSVGMELSVETKNPDRYKPMTRYRLLLGQPPHCRTLRDEMLFTVPPHSVNFVMRSDNEQGSYNPTVMTFKESGVITLMGAHLHPWEGGKKLDVYLNGILVRSFVAHQASLLPWSWTTSSADKSPISVEAGDILSIAATYSNPTAQPIVDAMGRIGFLFSPNDTIMEHK